MSVTAADSVLIEDLAQDGRGVAHVGGKVVFIDGALPGERVVFQRRRRHRNFDEGTACEVLEPAPHRTAPRCAHFGVCGGCVIQHLAPAAQIEFKERALLDALERIGRVVPATVLAPITGSPWGYRRRARLGVRYVRKKNRVLVGFRERHAPYVADLRGCEVLDPRVGRLIGPLAELVGALSIASRVPQIEVAAADETVALVLRTLDPATAEDRALLEAFEERYGVRFFLQPDPPAPLEPLTNPTPELRYRLPAFDVTLAFGPLDFIQVNGEVNARMVERALELLAPEPGHRVLDLFCGLGNFTLPLARRAAFALGVEGDAGLVERARRNAAANGLADRTAFEIANLFEPVGDFPWARQRFDRILLDPPRAGAREIIARFPAFGAERIVYVSCHPGTLARDAAMLVHEQGWRLEAAGILDMFPHTAHVESIAVFAR